jgi:hypothetical protein
MIRSESSMLEIGTCGSMYRRGVATRIRSLVPTGRARPAIRLAHGDD